MEIINLNLKLQENSNSIFLGLSLECNTVVTSLSFSSGISNHNQGRNKHRPQIDHNCYYTRTELINKQVDAGNQIIFTYLVNSGRGFIHGIYRHSSLLKHSINDV